MKTYNNNKNKISAFGGRFNQKESWILNCLRVPLAQATVKHSFQSVMRKNIFEKTNKIVS